MRYLLILMILGQANLKGQNQIRTGPVTEKDRVAFRLREATTLTEAMNTTVRLRVDSSASNSEPYTTVVPPRICNRQGNFYECETYIPLDIVTRLNVPGKHQLFSFIFDGNSGESIASESWTITMPAGKP